MFVVNAASNEHKINKVVLCITLCEMLPSSNAITYFSSVSFRFVTCRPKDSCRPTLQYLYFDPISTICGEFVF